MTKPKTRCRDCRYHANSVKQDPCSKCNEIQYKERGFENHFLPKSKDLFNREEVKQLEC